jgi:hypothetical protein
MRFGGRHRVGQKKMVQYQGREVEGEVLEFEAKSAENWNNYALEDGSNAKVKAVLLEVVRLSEYLPNGEPVYQLSAQLLIGTTVADALKKKLG